LTLISQVDYDELRHADGFKDPISNRVVRLFFVNSLGLNAAASRPFLDCAKSIGKSRIFVVDGHRDKSVALASV